MSKKIGFIGSGNMAQSIIRAFLDDCSFDKASIFATNRTAGKLQKLVETFGICGLQNNEELIESVDIVVLAVKPQDLVEALEPIASTITPDQMVLSLAAGIPVGKLKKLVPQTKALARIMPNTPVGIRQAVVGYCFAEGGEAFEPVLEKLLKPLGMVVKAPEGDCFEALTVCCGSGTGFVLELMQYWQEWLEEHGFDPRASRQMTVQTFLGSAMLASVDADPTLVELQNKVVSKKGVTAAGLKSMQELEIERALRYSFEKAALRDRELSKL